MLEINPIFKSEGYSLKCQTSQLNEDLGLIEYIFSDKTGTLTKNNMVFKSMFLNGKRYGSIHGSSEVYLPKTRHPADLSSKKRMPAHLGGEFPESSEDERLSSQSNSNRPTRSKGNNRNIEDRIPSESVELQAPVGTPQDVVSSVKSALQSKELSNTLFFTILTCCHEVAVKKDSATGEKVLNASSPDEVALLKFATQIGFDIDGFNEQTMEILVKDSSKHSEAPQEAGNIETLKYKLLAQFRFTSERSRMSVIVVDQQNQKTYLLSKGADHVMIERAGNYIGCTKDSLKGVLNDYSAQGLRTLVYGYKELSEEQTQTIIGELKVAESKIGRDKDVKIAEIVDQIERGLQIIAASAVEDELQDDVRDTLRSLRNADIKVWMLTGDKFETAINIGYSSGLLKPEDKLIELKPEEETIKEEEIRNFFKALESSVDSCC
jgi:phospholipid-translocating ATPase